MRKRSPAPHTDVEELAVKLDNMCQASNNIGVELHAVQQAAIELRNLSCMLADALELPPIKGDETYWISLGRSLGGGHYAQSLIDLPSWRDSAFRDERVDVLLKVTFDSSTGRSSVTVEKNLGNK